MGRADRHPRLSTDLPGGIWGPINDGNLQHETRKQVLSGAAAHPLEGRASPAILCRGLGQARPAQVRTWNAGSRGSLQVGPVNLGGSPSKAPASQAARKQAEGAGGALEKTREGRREEKQGREEALL